jgi:polysaccharide biosynthesis/export protein
MFFTRHWRLLAPFLFCMPVALLAQQPFPLQTPGQQQPAPEQNPSGIPQAAPVGGAAQQLPPDAIRPNYVLGANDQILIRAPGLDEVNEKPFRVDADGNITLPLLGKIKAGGMTLQELEAEVTKRAREYIVDPQVIINVTQFRSEPVFFVGAFRAPGIYPLQGARTLVEMLIRVGGLQPNASRYIKVTRRAEYGPIPLPSAIEDPEKKISSVQINFASLTQSINPAEDILLQPYDQISAEPAEPVYVSGEVGKVGAFELGERESISMAQAITMAGGFGHDASRGNVRILRPVMNTTRRAAIDVNVKRILEGKDNDIPLLPGDILYVPRSYSGLFWRTVGSISLSIIPYTIFYLTR